MPAALGLLILGPALAGTTVIGTVTLGAVVGTLVITGALIGLSLILAPRAPKPEDGSLPLRQEIAPRIGGYGRMRVAGNYMLYEEHEGLSLDVLAVISGEIGGFVKFYLHDDEVQINADGIVQPLNDGRYAGAIQIRTRRGLATETAYPEAIAQIPEIWTTAHRGDGTASLYMSCKSVAQEDQFKVYPHGLPSPSAEADLYKVWDPRDPTQLRGDPTTWLVSSNPVLQLIDFLTHPDHGMGLPYHTLIAPVVEEWIVEANLCDEIIATVDGSEKRYTSNGTFNFETDPEEVLGNILAACDGWLTESGDGTLTLKVGVYRAPADDAPIITARHILGFGVNYGVPAEERVNELALSFFSPAHQYKETPITAWRDEADISASGKVRSRPLACQWVHSFTQARRLAKRAMVRLNPGLRGKVIVTLYGLALLGERWVRLQYPFIAGLEDAVVEIQSADIDLTAGRIVFEWIKIDPATIDAWDPETEEGPAPFVPEKLLGDPLPVPQDVQGVIVELAGGNIRIDLDWLQPVSTLGVSFDELTYVVRYRQANAGGEPGVWLETYFDEPTVAGEPARVYASIFPTAPTDQYEIQVASVGSTGTRSDWSTPLLLIGEVDPPPDENVTLREDDMLILREDETTILREEAS